MITTSTVTQINTLLADYTDEVVRTAQTEMEEEGFTFNAEPTGTYQIDSTGAVWVQIIDHVNHGSTFWFTMDRDDMAGPFWRTASVESLDEIEKQDPLYGGKVDHAAVAEALGE